jgi:hypothetical protein
MTPEWAFAGEASTIRLILHLNYQKISTYQFFDGANAFFSESTNRIF